MADDLSKQFAQEQSISDQFASEPDYSHARDLASTAAEDKGAEEAQRELSQPALKAAGRGLVEGTTLGTASTFLGGALNAIKESPVDFLRVATGDRSLDALKNLYNSYRKGQQRYSKETEQIKEESPLAFHGAQTFGNLVAGGLTAGAGLGAGEQAVQGAAKEGGASLLSSLAKAGAFGAESGGTIAAASSPHTIEEPGKLGVDVLKGVLLGGGLGLAGEGISQAASRFPFLKNLPILEDQKQAYQIGKEGTSLSELPQEALETSGELAQDIMEHQKELAGNYETAKDISESLNPGANLPILAETDPQYAALHRGLREMGMEGKLSSSMRQQRQLPGILPDEYTSPLQENIYSFINKYSNDPVAKQRLENAANFIKQTNPQLATNIETGIKNQADRLNLAQQASSMGDLNPMNLKNIFNIKGKSLSLANAAGQVNYGVNKLLPILKKIPPGSLSNASLFTLLQNPATRALLESGDENK